MIFWAYWGFWVGKNLGAANFFQFPLGPRGGVKPNKKKKKHP